MGRGDDLEAAGEEFEEGGAMVEAGSAVKKEHGRAGAAMEDLELNVSDGESAVADCAHAHRGTSVSSPWTDFKQYGSYRQLPRFLTFKPARREPPHPCI